MEITEENVRELVEEYEGKGDTETFRNEIPLTPRSKDFLK